MSKSIGLLDGVLGLDKDDPAHERIDKLVGKLRKLLEEERVVPQEACSALGCLLVEGFAGQAIIREEGWDEIVRMVKFYWRQHWDNLRKKLEERTELNSISSSSVSSTAPKKSASGSGLAN